MLRFVPEKFGIQYDLAGLKARKVRSQSTVTFVDLPTPTVQTIMRSITHSLSCRGIILKWLPPF